jgi:hypothetical protein
VTSQERYVIVLQSACEWVLRVAKQQATYYMMRRDFAWSLRRVSLALGCCGISSHVKGNGLGAGGLCVCVWVKDGDVQGVVDTFGRF